MQIEALGFSGEIKQKIDQIDLTGFELGRVLIEHKERYTVHSNAGIVQAEITGNLRFSAQDRADFPAVGDWVKMMKIDEQTAVILEVLPRITVLERQAVYKHGEVQIIATNIDVAFIMQAVGHDFNLKRMERYLSICYAAHIEPIIVLSKIDLITESEVRSLKQKIKERVSKVEILAISSDNMEGYAELQKMMEPSKTYCVLGSSGVGKSTLINRLLGQDQIDTSAISTSTNKGRHTTSHRELFVLPNGSIMIDTPGMRELGMAEQAEGISQTYDYIEELARECKFNDCTHSNEKGCAVLDALEKGEISEDAFENYHKLMREQARFSASVREKRKKDKQLGKMYKATIANKKKYKY